MIVVLFILHVASMQRAECLDHATPVLPNLIIAMKSVSQLPHNAHISTASYLNNPGERNDVIEVNVRVQNM